jgi:hypothetical protein
MKNIYRIPKNGETLTGCRSGKELGVYHPNQGYAARMRRLNAKPGKCRIIRLGE